MNNFDLLVEELAEAREQRDKPITKALRHNRVEIVSLADLRKSLGLRTDIPSPKSLPVPPRPKTPTPAEVMAKALSLQAEGKLTAYDIARLEAMAHRLDAARAR